METKRLETLKQIAAGIAAQFGDKCEVVIHDVSSSHPEHTIVHIENGHVSGRKVGDGASMVVLEQLEHQHEQPQDHLCYLTRTPDGKILKSSSLYIRNSRGAVTAIFSINYDVTGLMMMPPSQDWMQASIACCCLVIYVIGCLLKLKMKTVFKS